MYSLEQAYRWGQVALVLGVGFLLAVSGCKSSPSTPSSNSEMSNAKIGVVDSQRLLGQTKVGKQVNESLNRFMTDRQALIDLEQKELREMESALLRQGSVLTASAKKQREEQFRRRMMEYQQKVGDLNREVQAKQAELLGEFHVKVEEVATVVAEKHGLDIVLEKGPNTTTRYYRPSLDITDEIRQEMDAERP